MNASSLNGVAHGQGGSVTAVVVPRGMYGTVPPLSCTEAQKRFFLQPSDLMGVPYTVVSSGGRGRPKHLYSVKDLLDVATKKHGMAGLESKMQKRARREKKKQSAAPLTNQEGGHSASQLQEPRLSRKKRKQIENKEQNLQSTLAPRGTHDTACPLSCTEAQKKFFLQANDLIGVPHKVISSGGRGRPKYLYSFRDVLDVATKKHGKVGLKSKMQKRVMREEKKQNAAHLTNQEEQSVAQLQGPGRSPKKRKQPKAKKKISKRLATSSRTTPSHLAKFSQGGTGLF